MVDDLEPESSYRFRVNAMNIVGQSSFSKPTGFVETKVVGEAFYRFTFLCFLPLTCGSWLNRYIQINKNLIKAGL